jgi:hypothetical protein
MNINPEIEKFMKDNADEFKNISPEGINKFASESQELYNAGFTPSGEIKTRLDEIKRKFAILKNEKLIGATLSNSNRMIRTASNKKLSRIARRRAVRFAASDGYWKLTKDEIPANAPKKKQYSKEEIAKMKEEAKTDPQLAKMLKELGIV